MARDQADNLRELVQGAGPAVREIAVGLPMVVVTGGRAGVGTTTVAVNLAAVLADGHQRVLLVDAAAARCNMNEVAGVKSSQVKHTLSDVLAGRCSTGEALTPGPVGTVLLAHRVGRRSDAGHTRRNQHRLLEELQSLRSDFDLTVVDLGNGLTPCARRFWLQAQLVLLVSTADSSSLMDSYATIKRSVADGIGPDVRLVVNQCEDDRVAADAHCRFSSACSRFLGHSVPSLPSLPQAASADGMHSRPRVWERPNTPFGHAMLWLGRAVGDALSTAAMPLGAAAA